MDSLVHRNQLGFEREGDDDSQPSLAEGPQTVDVQRRRESGQRPGQQRWGVGIPIVDDRDGDVWSITFVPMRGLARQARVVEPAPSVADDPVELPIRQELDGSHAVDGIQEECPSRPGAFVLLVTYRTRHRAAR